MRVGLFLELAGRVRRSSGFPLKENDHYRWAKNGPVSICLISENRTDFLFLVCMRRHQITAPVFQSTKPIDIVNQIIKHGEIETGHITPFPVEGDHHQSCGFKTLPVRLKNKHFTAKIHAAVKRKNNLKIPSFKTDMDCLEDCACAFPKSGLTIPIKTTATHHRLSGSRRSQRLWRISLFGNPVTKILKQIGIKRQILPKHVVKTAPITWNSMKRSEWGCPFCW